jgi:phage head maturation protease
MGSSIPDIEYRSTLSSVDAIGDNSVGGHALPLGKRSVPLGMGWVEIFEDGCFNKARGDGWGGRVYEASFKCQPFKAGWPGVVSRFNMDDSLLLGTSSTGTLQLSIEHDRKSTNHRAAGIAVETPSWLDYVVGLPDSQRHIYSMAKWGELAMTTVGFKVHREEWDTPGESRYPVRHVIGAQLFEVSPVSRPSLPDPEVALRALAEKVRIPLADVVKLAAANELSSLFEELEEKP